MATGKAIVSTSSGCEEINVSHGKNITAAGNPEDFANRTIQMLRNSNVRVNLEKSALKLARTYDWDQ